MTSQYNSLVLAQSVCNINALLWIESRTTELLVKAVRFIKAIGKSEPIIHGLSCNRIEASHRQAS